MKKTALITGTNRGIGLELTKQYAQAGWLVHACARKTEEAKELKELASDFDDQIILHKLDVSDFNAIDALANELSHHPIEVLINNAGIYEREGNHFGTIDYENWHNSFQVNTMAPLKMIEAFVGAIKLGQEKKIVCISSKVGSLTDNTSGGRYIYRSSKTALNMVIKSLSIDLRPQSIIAIAMHPGWVLTDMGGPHALITVEQSVNGMRQVIEDLKQDDTGCFFNYDGDIIPW